ncbi:MAG TPA: DUF2905 domain-containing protein [Acidimicrobiia bacterium]
MRISNILILVGAGLLIVGVVLRYFPGAFSWFGNLPGDIKYQSGNTQVFIPITSMLVVSIVATVVVNVAVRLFRGD